MTDEKYVFITDVGDKKRTASGSYHRRTHAGKGGRVRFPSDYLTKKELQAMSGEAKSYRLNDPMSWAEFMAMPDDLKVTYIKLLRERYNVPDSNIGEMMGADKDRVSRCFIKLGLNGKQRRSYSNWDKEGWLRWANGLPSVEDTTSEEEATVNEDEAVVDVIEQSKEAFESPNVPTNGSLTFDCPANIALGVIEQLLGCTKARLNIMWEITDQAVVES